MTDKEFKQLNRAQLIEIIYQLQLQVDELTKQNQSLEKALEDKRFRINIAGNIAEAALEINDCFRNAQNAAEQYLNEIKAMHEEAETARREAKAERARILATARAEVDAIVASAQKRQCDYDSAVDAILTEYRNQHTNNR